ncbi:GFA family protein [Celerinatantimonas sp. YJH-8]|uniref:GFA family protein n=1 Tax=Celerinatantimonas sp. YJH-8 TaxID=3228714 RepID=UPI0038C266BF
MNDSNHIVTLQGGCLCGAIRYAIDAILIDAGFCHCKLCQRASGAPAVAWLTIPFTGFSYTQGEIGVYASSANYQREFCSHCGTPLAFRAMQDPKTIDVTLCSLDDPTAVKPQYHIWCQSKINWLHLDDDLPQFMDAGPDEL